jgi:hypothetical protein
MTMSPNTPAYLPAFIALMTTFRSPKGPGYCLSSHARRHLNNKGRSTLLPLFLAGMPSISFRAVSA